MRTFQFWILVLASTMVSALMIKQIFLSRDLKEQQRQLIDTQEMITQGNSFETYWKQLAMGVFQASRQDPTLAAVLKDANVQVHTKPAAAPGSVVPVPTAPPLLPNGAPMPPAP
jgi:hypothetical protein